MSVVVDFPNGEPLNICSIFEMIWHNQVLLPAECDM